MGHCFRTVLWVMVVGFILQPVYGSFEQARSQIKDVLSQTRGDKQKILESFYEKNGYAPAWFDEKGWLERRKNAQETLRQVEVEGLSPPEYAYGLIEPQTNDPKAICLADIALTRAVLDYRDDLKGDRFDPRKIHRDIDFPPRNYDAAQGLYQDLQQDPQGKLLQAFTLNHPAYQKLKKVLADLRVDKTPPSNPIPLGKPLKVGMTDPRILLIRSRLGLEGTSATFDADLEKQVKEFQHRHGIDADGVIGERSLVILNQTTQDRINQVLATMEKWRWIPEDLGPRYVMVNIPSFTLEAHDVSKPLLKMKVIIGKSYRHTPIFMSKIDEVRFNPAWHVPHGIAVQDKLKIIRDNPSYLSEKGFTVYDDGGGVVDPSQVDWSSLTPETFTYRLVQSPGSANALGKIRFNIPSRFNVYLHSTPDKKLFDKDVRSFSSGCIRIEKPDEMGAWVLNDDALWPLTKVQHSMEGNETRNVKPQQDVPVIITYMTVWFDDQDHPVYADDIYQQDPWLIQAMTHANSPAIIR